MADIIVGTFPATGHVVSLQPIVRELVRRRHSVRWYTSERYAGQVAATGAVFEPMSPHLDRLAGDLDERYPERAALKGLKRMKWDLKHLFMDPVAEQVEELRLLRARRPTDVLLCDPGFGAARQLGELVGLPWISVGSTPLTLPSRDTAPFGSALPPSSSVPGRLRNAALGFVFNRVVMRDVVAYRDALRVQTALPPAREDVMGAGISPHLHLQSGVAELEYPRSDLPPYVHFIGSLDDDVTDPRPMPAWWEEVRAANRPIVHVTQGTVANTELDDLLLPTLRSLAGQDVVVVATLGDDTARRVLPSGLPDNAYVAPYLPYSRFLPHVDVMVTNGGFGGVNEALRHGVPLVVAAGSEEKPEVAARVAYSGAGIDLRTGKPDPAAIRRAVHTVLAGSAHRERAAELAKQYAAVQAGPRAADLIEQVVLTHC
ncbi:glycosyltransferase [Streptomyces sp. AC627_RSS907]|uniref:glycosyltransferase n=1 Tax=Streptomyces sp. AC627_RSS907 TaxID=2823684 RepID=UPI001C24EE9B|nr:nucleotide disphospho-sugar-binding domain-containing protein [Streptomyces sp. AC627_RSS907]